MRFLLLAMGMAWLLVCPVTLIAQDTDVALRSPNASGDAAAAPAAFTRPAAAAPAPHTRPFSRVALAGGISAMGIRLQAATYLSRYFDLRTTGSVFSYSVNQLKERGFLVNGNLAFAAAGTALDYYPFPKHGLRFSPGMLFYNQSGATADIHATGTTSFTFNGTTYYSSPKKPVTAIGSLDLHTQMPAFTITAGWGRFVAHGNRHLSFPFEVGVAMIGTPVPSVTFTGGQFCSKSNGTDCGDVVGNASVEKNLHAQLVKDQRSLSPLRFYPVLSFGVAYTFPLGRRRELPNHPPL